MAEGPYDAVVVGAGLVGATAALGLARAGRRVALVDRRRPVAMPGRLGFDVRTVALTPACLGHLGVDVPGAPIRRMRVWEEDGTGVVDFDSRTAGCDALAHVVEVGATSAALWRACESLAGVAGVDVRCGSVTGLSHGAGAMRVAIGDEALFARLVIAADGAESEVRRLAGVEILGRGGFDAALATVVRTERVHGGTALQRFGRHGPLAFLPLRDAHCSAVIWSQDRAACERLRALDDESFATALHAASEGALGRFEAVDERYAFPLAQRLVRDCNPRPRLLLIGDAAHTVHPLAGQGVNLGIEDAARVVEVSADATDLGGANLWRGFARRRRARAEAMVALMTALRSAYGYGGPVGRWLRNFGVRGLDGAPAAKRWLIREAMGQGILGRAL